MLKVDSPQELHALNRFAVRAMTWLNGFAHLVIGLALAIAVLMFTWLFYQDVVKAATAHNLVHGFLRALGTLMLLWSISALITAEIRYLLGHDRRAAQAQRHAGGRGHAQSFRCRHLGGRRADARHPLRTGALVTAQERR